MYKRVNSSNYLPFYIFFSNFAHKTQDLYFETVCLSKNKHKNTTNRIFYLNLLRFANIREITREKKYFKHHIKKTMKKIITLLNLALLGGSITMNAAGPIKRDSTSRNEISTRSAAEVRLVRSAVPLDSSLWIDRDAVVHDYSPENLVKKVLLNSRTVEDEQRIQNVEHIGWNWDKTTGTWSGSPTPAHSNVWGRGGDAIWAADERSLVHFQRGPKVNENIFDLEKGLLLATGPALTAEGPNETNHALSDGVMNNGLQGMHDATNYPDSFGFHKNQANWTPGHSFDRDLDGLTNPNYNLWSTCGSVLEFDFQPAINEAFFDYIFASDEYPEGIYEANDVFGFFITGPYDTPPGSDIEQTTAKPSSVDPKTLGTPNRRSNDVYYRYNIARLPDNNPVGIDYVNWGKPTIANNFLYNGNWVAKTWEYQRTTSADYNMALPDTMTSGVGNWPQTYYVNLQSAIDPTPGNASTYNMNHIIGLDTFWYSIPTNPELFRYNHVGENLMEYDGYTQKLRAIADKLLPGKWYHLKLAICQTRQVSPPSTYYLDNNHGSGCFLANLDLGAATLDFTSQYLSGTRANSQFHQISAGYDQLDEEMKGLVKNIITSDSHLTIDDTTKYKGFIYSGCNYTIEKEKLSFSGVGDIVLHTYNNVLDDYFQIDSLYISDEKVEYCYEGGTGMRKDISKYVWGNDTIRRNTFDVDGTLYFSIKQLPLELNGTLSGIVNLVYPGGNPTGDTILIIAYSKVETDVKHSPVTEVSPGSLTLNIKGGSNYLRWTTVYGIECNAEFNDDCKWRYLRNTETGQELPFSRWELLSLYDGDNPVPLVLQEPGSCWYDTIWIGGGRSPVIQRAVDIPYMQGVITEPKAGRYYVAGHKNFSFTATYDSDSPINITATGFYSKKTIDLDNTAELQSDGSYKYTIYSVTEPWTVNFAPKTTSGDVSNKTNLNSPLVWTYGNLLYVNCSKTCSMKIYTLTGILYKQEEVHSNKIIQLPAGFYIVDIDNEQYKVIVK